MQNELERINDINVLSCNGNKATVEVLDEDQLQELRLNGFKFHREECNIFLVIKP